MNNLDSFGSGLTTGGMIHSMNEIDSQLVKRKQAFDCDKVTVKQQQNIHWLLPCCHLLRHCYIMREKTTNCTC
jgi:hypothetical protein